MSAEIERNIRTWVSEELSKKLDSFEETFKAEYPKIDQNRVYEELKKVISESLPKMVVEAVSKIDPKIENMHHDLASIDSCPNCGPLIRNRDLENYNKGVKEAQDAITAQQPKSNTGTAVDPTFPFLYV